MSADHSLVETWVRGWALSRKTSPPVTTPYGFRIDVGLPEHRTRHIVAALEPDRFRELASTIREPWTFLKVCAAHDEVRPFLSDEWQLDEPRYLMTCALADGPKPDTAAGFRLHSGTDGDAIVAEIIDGRGEIAANGRAAISGDAAIFDQIGTEKAFRRRGLGRSVMSLLSQAAIARGARRGVLVASLEGHLLYTRLGWTTVSPFTSAAIREAR